MHVPIATTPRTTPRRFKGLTGGRRRRPSLNPSGGRGLQYGDCEVLRPGGASSPTFRPTWRAATGRNPARVLRQWHRCPLVPKLQLMKPNKAVAGVHIGTPDEGGSTAHTGRSPEGWRCGAAGPIAPRTTPHTIRCRAPRPTRIVHGNHRQDHPHGVREHKRSPLDLRDLRSHSGPAAAAVAGQGARRRAGTAKYGASDGQAGLNSTRG